VTIVTRVLGASPRAARRLGAALAIVPMLISSCQPACAPGVPAAPRVVEQRRIGTSVQGRPIVAYRVGKKGGVPVLAVGQIHGDEHAGIEIAEYLRDTAPIPAGFDVWVIPTVNPDGNAANRHVNAHGVDLNRNFAPDWRKTDCAASPRYCSGPAPMSEPESKAVAAFVGEIKPRMTVWYHGPLFTVDRALLHGVAHPAVLTAYARAAGYQVSTVACSPTGHCTGNATQYMNTTIAGSSAFVVELSTNAAGGISPKALVNHTNAFYAAAAVA
jgi:murein peptide amidase A